MKILLLKIISSLLLITLYSNTNAQLVLERDINTEPASSEPSDFAELDGFLYFRADDGVHGQELYRFDLQNGNAELVADIRPFDDSSIPNNTAAFDGKIFFSARDGNSSLRHLMVYDPLEDTVVLFRDAGFQTVREPFNLHIFNDQLFFSAEFSGSGAEPAKYDPITNEVVMLADINPSGNSSASFFTKADGKLWFSAIDGVSNSRLWQYDPDTELVSRIDYISPDEIYPNINFLYHFDGRLYFSGTVSGKGAELYVYDITTNTLLDIPEIYPGPASSSPGPFIAFDDKIYFPARTAATGRELWVFNPADSSVELLHDFVEDGNGNPSGIFILDDIMYITANDAVTQERNLYSYETDGSVTEIAGLDFGGNPNYLNILSVADNRIFLYGRDLEHGTELFSYTPGSDSIELAADINQTTIGSFPYQFTEYNGKLYFGAEEPLLGREVWVYNPANGQTDLLTSAPGNTSPYGFTVLDDKLFFAGIYPGLGYGMLYYDDQTRQVSATPFITPGNTGHIDEVIAFNEMLLFGADDENNNKQLHVYNPVSEEVGIVGNINQEGGSYPSSLFTFDNKLFFSADDGLHGTELWVYDGSETSLAADINPGEMGSSPQWFAAYDGELYFSAFTPDTSYEIFSYNPTNGTLTQRTNVDGNLNPEFLAIYQNKLYMKGRLSGSQGTELLVYDAEADTIMLAADIGPGSSNPSWLTVFNNKLYFAATTDEFGTELWEYNGENAVIYADIYMGVPGSQPEWLTVFNNKLYFSANDGEKGAEIWSLAGCINVFVNVAPVYHPDSLSTVSLTVEGGTPPYNILWSNGSTNQDPGQLPPGNYTVRVIDATGCIVKLDVEVVFLDPTNVTEISEEALSLFPNPSNGIFTLRWDDYTAKELLIFDIQGRKILGQKIRGNETQIEVNLSRQNKGFYFIQLRTDRGMIYKKVTVQ